MADILITGATVITMDPERRVIEDGAVTIDSDRITAVGSRAEIEATHSALTVIDASRMVCLPGLVDVHGHAGHALVKTMDHDSFTRWRETVELIYAEGVDEEFWYAEALSGCAGKAEVWDHHGSQLLRRWPDAHPHR